MIRRNLHRLWFCLLVFISSIQGWSFVYYPVGNNPLRWNVDSGAAHPNVVNPATKAIRYYIASDAYSAANREAEIAAVKACFDQWQSVPGNRLKFEFAGFVNPAGLDVAIDNTNVVFWVKQSLSVDSGRMNISGLRGWTSVNFAEDGSIIEADIVLNGNQYQWFTDFNNTTSQAQFVEAILLHEIGHFLGLDHGVIGGATVVIGANGVSAEAGLSSDEISAVRYLYPTATVSSGSIKGTVRLNGTGILGAAVIAEDAQGNVASASVSRATGEYDLPGLPAGNYFVRVSPLDPANSGSEKLIRGSDIAPEYASAVTSFSATTNIPVAVTAGQVHTLDFSVASGPVMRITSISKPTTIPDLVSVNRAAVTLLQGQANFYIAVSGETLKSGSFLNVSGGGITVGPTTFLENRIAGRIHSLVAPVTVNSDATPGLRSFIVTHGSDIAYGNGFLEIASPIPDYNFDGLDDRFQRQYWTPWTAPASAPANDPDTDLFSNQFEYRTGTNPTNALSNRLEISSINRTSSSTTLKWLSDPGKRYQLHGRSAFESGAWEAIGRALTAASPEMILTDSSPEGAKFYQLELLP